MNWGKKGCSKLELGSRVAGRRACSSRTEKGSQRLPALLLFSFSRGLPIPKHCCRKVYLCYCVLFTLCSVCFREASFVRRGEYLLLDLLDRDGENGLVLGS